jgi:hypothetical protein
VQANAHKTLLLAGSRTNAQRSDSICKELHLNQQNTTLLIGNKNLKFLSHFLELRRHHSDVATCMQLRPTEVLLRPLLELSFSLKMATKFKPKRRIKSLT